VKREELENAAKLVKQTMEGAFPLSIPIETEARFGTTWGNLEPMSL
jgi:DNA polymerase I-like protein with 3'-5' exonuclease and polymerase domains